MTITELIGMMCDGESRSIEISCDGDNPLSAHLKCRCGDGKAERTIRAVRPGSFDDVVVDWEIARTMRDAERQ